MIKRITLATTVAIATLIAAPVIAADEYNVSSGLTAAGAPLALHGVDPVSFNQTGNRTQGVAKFSAVHDGVTYYFATQANLDQFNGNPTQFLPQNGGFCTFGVSVSKKFDGNPRWSDVRDGKLYVFLSAEIFAAYQKDPAGTIAKAEKNWKNIQHTAAAEL